MNIWESVLFLVYNNYIDATLFIDYYEDRQMANLEKYTRVFS